MSLKNKKVVVTGASKGLGLGIIRRLADEGAAIIAHYNSGDIKQAEMIAEAAGVPFFSYKADFTKIYEVLEMADKITESGEIYGLVNNAGVSFFEDFFEITPEHFDSMIDINIKSAFFLTQKITKHMIQNGIKGRIVNFSSIAAEAGNPAQIHYGAAKGAVNSFTKAAAAALGQYGITVNAIVPGPIPTEHNGVFLADETITKALTERIAMGAYGKPENIADAVVYLLGDKANWITGSLLTVDGGFLCK